MYKVTPLPALTSLRFFAAALIVIQHSAGYFNIGTSLTQNFTLIHGVSFFFVLSGFILSYAHYNLSGAGNTIRFLWARIARVLPAHLFTMSALYALWVYAFNTGYNPTLKQTILNIFLLQAWDPYPSTYFSYNGVSWTLSVEMFFYLIFPVILLTVKRSALLATAASSILVIAALLICRLTDAPISTTDDIPSAASWTYVWPPARLLEFTIGVVAGCLFVKHRHRIESFRWQSLLGVAGISLIVAGSIFTTFIGWWLEGRGFILGDIRGWLVISGAAPFFALGLVMLSTNKGLISIALSLKPMVILGEISFSIYLIHQIVIRSMMIKSQDLSGIDYTIQLIAYWAVVLILSYGLWICVEKPCQKWMNSWFKRATPKTAADPA